jgi:hypothetical protein
MALELRLPVITFEFGVVWMITVLFFVLAVFTVKDRIPP